MGSNLDDLVAISREYGSDPDWVVAGGGNTSLKIDDVLYVKASGYPLATIGEDGFARMDRSKLGAIWDADYPAGYEKDAVAERERLVLADMMAARLPGEERRPSVETVLHDLLPWPLVVHLHPTLVNGLTCGVRGPEIASEILGNTQEWIPVCDPGYVLAKNIKVALERRSERGEEIPEYILLANHGVFVGGEDADEIRKKYSLLHSALEDRLKRRPGPMPKIVPLPQNDSVWRETASRIFSGETRIAYVSGGELDRYLKSPEAARPLTMNLTPDHIVYSGPGALFLDSGSAEDWAAAVTTYTEERGKPPNITLINNDFGLRGALVTASGEKALANAILLLENAIAVCVYSENFGGPLGMEEPFVRFIVDWEVENYRSKVVS